MKKVLVFFLLVVGTLTYAITLNEAIPPSVIAEGEKKFPAGKDIFKGVLSDPDAWKAVRDEAVARMKAIFTDDCVQLLSGTRDGKYTATVKLNDQKIPRKTIIDREWLELQGNKYLVVATQKGIKVHDAKTGYELEVEKIDKRR